jgi:hypothetical protein
VSYAQVVPPSFVRAMCPSMPAAAACCGSATDIPKRLGRSSGSKYPDFWSRLRFCSVQVAPPSAVVENLAELAHHPAVRRIGETDVVEDRIGGRELLLDAALGRIFTF